MSAGLPPAEDSRLSCADLVIGVDGGGTKTVAWLAALHDGDKILGRGVAGPGNVRAAGFDVATANIRAAIDAAFADAQLPRQCVAAACLSLAGAGRAQEQVQISEWAKNENFAQRIRVTTDAEPILAAGSAENWGIAIICGTGSLAWGRSRTGETARRGGWGYLLGDEGSAYAIALAGLRAAARTADGRGEAVALLAQLQTRLGAATPQGLIEKVYAAQMTRERIADLAEVVFAAAEVDDISRTIIQQASAELAELVTSLAAGLGLQARDYPLALAGGVLLNQQAFRHSFLEQLSLLGAEPREVALIAEPVRGAVALARKMV